MHWPLMCTQLARELGSHFISCRSLTKAKQKHLKAVYCFCIRIKFSSGYIHVGQYEYTEYWFRDFRWRPITDAYHCTYLRNGTLRDACEFIKSGRYTLKSTDPHRLKDTSWYHFVNLLLTDILRPSWNSGIVTFSDTRQYIRIILYLINRAQFATNFITICIFYSTGTIFTVSGAIILWW